MTVPERLWSSVTEAFSGIAENADKLIYGAIKLVLIIVGARVLIAVLSTVIKKSMQRRAAKKPDTLAAKKCDTMTTLLQSAVRYIIDFIMAVMILDLFGLGGTIGSLLATAGIGGIALGLGAQSFLKDIIGGMFMLFDDEYAVGDYIRIPSIDLEGTVSAISIRNTRLRLVHGETATIPHGSIDTVINYTRDSYSLFLDYDISGEEDDVRAADVVLEVINVWLEENMAENGEAQYLGFTNMQPFKSTLKFVFRLPPLKQWSAEREINRNVYKSFREKGIKLPDVSSGIFVEKSGA